MSPRNGKGVALYVEKKQDLLKLPSKCNIPTSLHQVHAQERSGAPTAPWRKSHHLTAIYISMPRWKTEGDAFSEFHMPTILDGVIVTCMGDGANGPPFAPVRPPS